MKNTIKNMKKMRSEMFSGIESTPGYKEASEKFDQEYAIAEVLHKARLHAHLSQKDIAKRMKTTQSVISRMESGANISVAKLQKYAEACGAKLHINILF